ncbi:MAG: hypothetical protein M3O71_32420 [Bacteroidota bacterium]|nr:hypothetical protein [Bacteroidota bacterium]
MSKQFVNIMDKELEILRLEKLLNKIDVSKNDDKSFDELYNLFIDEFELNPFESPNILKEARVYLSEKKKHPNNEKLNVYYYQEFLKDIRSFIFDKIQRIKHSTQ